MESHFTDENAGPFRAATYRRLRRHWQFINELKLFEIQDQKRYGINVYSGPQEPSFLQAASLYHPSTVEASLKHDGSGVEPGIKDLDGHWDLRPHASRIVRVDAETLTSWHAVLETYEVPIAETRMVYAVNRSTAAVLDKLSRAPRVGALGLEFSPGWHEKNDRTKGYFDSEWGVPESWDSVILQGPHLYVATPLYKAPNQSMLHHLDWTDTDLESLPVDAIPTTSYRPRGMRAAYDAAYTHWETPPGMTSARAFYRVAWRKMAANTGERTLIPALIPPGAAHIDGIFSAALPAAAPRMLPLVAASISTLVGDFLVRVAPKSDIRGGVIARLPVEPLTPLADEIVLRYLRLNCVTLAYADLWEECFVTSFRRDGWSVRDSRLSELGDIGPKWSSQVPLRLDYERRQALLEIDVLVALSLGITADELCTIYRTQFPVLFGYDTSRDRFDARGRRVPSAVLAATRRKARLAGLADDVWVHPGSGKTREFVPPFELLDREQAMRDAYVVFESRAASRAAKDA